MIVLDTDTLTFFFRNHSRVVEQMRQASDEIAITIISRIEILQGRFATLLKTANGDELQRGQQRLDEAERNLAKIPKMLPLDLQQLLKIALLPHLSRIKRGVSRMRFALPTEKPIRTLAHDGFLERLSQAQGQDAVRRVGQH